MPPCFHRIAFAYKLFRKIADNELAHVQPFIFEAETQAYEIIARSPELQKYTPVYFDQVTLSAVFEEL